MRETLEKLLQKLAVSHVLAPYETHPWVYYDEEKGITCNAEVRMGPGGSDLEAELQIFKDDPDDEDEEEGSSGSTGQIMWLRAQPVTDGKWSPKALRIKGTDYVNEIHDWEGKGCEFFSACVQALQMGEIPDIDMLIDDHMQDDSKGGGRRGRIGRKSPKANPAALMGMKK